MVHPTRVLICAADLVGRMGLTALLENDDAVTVVGQCVPSDDWSTVVALYDPDVILWDLGWNALDTLAELSEAVEYGPPILALIADGEEATTVWAAGTRGLLMRDGSLDALCISLLALAQGLSVIEPTLSETGAIPLGFDASLLVEPLTPREMDVIQAMAQGLSNKLIARHLAISEHTVKFHINAILGKLGAQSRTDAVVRATRAGLIRL